MIAEIYQARNKAIFDNLHAQRAAIEQRFGGALVWARQDGKLASKLYVQLDGVRLADEADWPRMTAFLSERCGRMAAAVQDLLERACAR